MLKRVLPQEEIEEIKAVVTAAFQGADFIALREGYNDEYYLSENENDFFNVEDFKIMLLKNGITNVNVDSGMTKIVLIPNDKDYVIKIPITKIGDYEYYVNEEEEWAKGKFIVRDNILGDYCSIEEKLFNSFDNEIKEIFAETRFITKVNNLPIYIQEKIKISYGKKINQFDPVHYLSDRKSDMDIHYELNSIDKYNAYYNEFQEDFSYDILVNYGFEFLIKLLQTIDSKGIMDLHSGNYGYNGNYKPMIFDYSGYGE